MNVLSFPLPGIPIVDVLTQTRARFYDSIILKGNESSYTSIILVKINTGKAKNFSSLSEKSGASEFI